MNKKNILNIIKISIILVLSFIAIRYETAVGLRLITIEILIFLLIASGIIRNYFLNNEITKVISFIVDIVIIFLLELQTKFVANYAFHFFYIFVLFESTFILNKKVAAIINSTTVVVSLIKYINILIMIDNYSKIGETLFIAFINIFILILLILFKSYKEEKEKTDRLFNQLIETSKKYEELAVIKERNRIASELHDSIGHKLTGLIMQLEMSEYYLDDNIKEAKTLIEQSKNTARNSLKQLREVVDAIKDPVLIDNFYFEIKKLAKEFQSMTRINVSVKKIGKEIALEPLQKISLYRIIQESMTNTAKHSDAQRIEIILKNDSQKIEAVIKDDGNGCSKIIEGNGLKSIRERIETIGGSVFFSGDNGFMIKIYI